MDIILFSKAKNRGPFQVHELRISKTESANINNTLKKNSIQESNSNLNEEKGNNHPSGAVFWPLPVKKIMMAEATHFIRSPLAEFVEHTFGFSYLFPFISANLISLTHCVLSVASIRFLIDDSLFWRQFGVCLFQFRNFLDSFDGVIYRAHAKRMTYKSHYGSLGYFVDAFSDVFGGICLIGSLAIYFIKHLPLNRSLTRCFRLVDDDQSVMVVLSSSSSCSSSPLSSSSSLSSTIINEKTIQSRNSCASNIFFPYSSNSQYDYQLKADKDANNNSNSNQINGSYLYKQLNNTIKEEKSSQYKETHPNNLNTHATKAVVLTSIALIGIRLAMSALFWDRSVHTYEDLLDTMPNSELHQQLQVSLLKSTITLIIMFSWRVMCALSLQDMILATIFINKTWEFIVKTQYIGWILLICLIILTELHVAEIRSILSQAI